MKAFIVCSLLSLVALATAEPPVGNKYLPPRGSYGAPSGFGGGVGGGVGGGYGGAGGYNDGPSEPANYEFSYQVKDDFGNDFGHSESRQGEVAKGRYYVLLPDGRTQVVEYTADENGYQPQVKYEGQAGGYPKGGSGGGYGGAQGGYTSGFTGAGSGGYPSGFGGGNDGYRY